MSSPDSARRTRPEVSFSGVNITSSLLPYFLSLTYTDNEEDETDDLQIKLHDREGVWRLKWLNDAVDAAASSQESGDSTGLMIEAVIARQNWNGGGKDDVLKCGTFELDTVKASGPPATISIKATSLPFNAQIRQTLKSKAWESYYLSGIAREMAATNGMTCMYLSDTDPFYLRVEQYKTDNMTFLKKLCHEAGISLKVTDSIIVLFDQASYEGKDAVRTIRHGDGSYTKYDMTIGTADTQYQSCRVSYVIPEDGTCIEGIATIEEISAGSSQSGSGGSQSGSSAIVQAAYQFAWPEGNPHNYWSSNRDMSLVTVPNDAYRQAVQTWAAKGPGHAFDASSLRVDNYVSRGASCDIFAGVVIRSALGNGDVPCRGPGIIANFMKNHPDKWKKISYGNFVSKLQPGDVMVRTSDGVYGHIQIFVGTTASGGPIIAEAQNQAATGHINTTHTSISGFDVYRYTGETVKGGSGNAKVLQQLEITAKVSSAEEAKALAKKYLRLHNKYARMVDFTLPGDTSLVAGVTFNVSGWGGWDGKYIIKRAVHTVSSSGYVVKITGRRILEGY